MSILVSPSGVVDHSNPVSSFLLRPIPNSKITPVTTLYRMEPFVQEFYKDWSKAEISPHYGYNSRG